MVCPALVFLLAAAPPAGTLPFSAPGWELRGDAAVERFEGRDTLRVDNGWALRPGLALQDGTVDLDVRVSRRRSFVYVVFRMDGERESEEMYLRPHKSSLPDAVQYAPVYQGQSAWQLYWGPGGTAAVAFEPGVWTHVRVIVSGRRAALFVGDMATPVLAVPRLGREPRAGGLGLRAFVPADTPGTEPAARFADVVVRPGAADLSAVTFPPVAEEPRAVRAWAVSEALPPSGGDDAPPAVSSWRTADALPGGLVELNRLVAPPPGPPPAPPARLVARAAARVIVRSAAAGTRPFDLGFSDAATVFLNGQPLYHGEAGYDFAGRRDGLIRYDQARLYLPLVAGENELVVVVTDGFGGMGLMGRFPDASGLTVEAR
jgi:hypothetical protein